MPIISWPDIKFGPVNLWSVVPAYWFYMSPEEKAEELAKLIASFNPTFNL